MTDLPLPLFCDHLPERDQIMLLSNREDYAAAKTAELQAERDALAARIAGGVRMQVALIDKNVYPGLLKMLLTLDEYDALLPLDGQTVTAIGSWP